ncbi:hypothetical protein ACH4C2_35220 [Streptomyces sp. NPDC018057]|uniref:hypothetical protein n=1 Tax=unclassified Streptomyces TaxID=2593676 RepID=UPI0037A9AC1B
MKALAGQRTAEAAQGAEPAYLPYVPAEPDDTTPLVQPVLIVAGSEAGSLWMSTALHGRARGPKRLLVVEGGTHMDFYDVPEYVGRAVAAAVPFFTGHLAAEPADQG